MNKNNIAENILARASSTLYFLEHAFKFAGMKADDIAWQRSILIMISYAFELILKAELVLTSKYTSTNDLDKELRKFGHGIQQIMEELKERNSLLLMKINDYQIINSNSFKQYTIIFQNKKEVTVEDFVDIRYDYTKTALRTVISHEIVTGYVDAIIELHKNVSSRKNQI